MPAMMPQLGYAALGRGGFADFGLGFGRARRTLNGDGGSRNQRQQRHKQQREAEDADFSFHHGLVIVRAELAPLPGDSSPVWATAASSLSFSRGVERLVRELLLKSNPFRTRML